jgi:nucleoside-diphosphate-sugar epimerase
MRVLVTGGGGYLGSVLVPRLVARGHDVRVVDIGYFGLEHLLRTSRSVEVLRDDVRSLTQDPVRLAAALDGVGCIVHLAAISNDPSAELDPQLTEEVNHDATARLAEAARAAHVRLLFSSSCSVYGSGTTELEEDAEPAPLSVYAATKLRAERTLGQLADSGWRPVVLRNGTLFGWSSRMRFDLVVNIFSLHCALYGQLVVFGPGDHWRPFLHVRDAARALVFFVERDEYGHSCYNVAHENRTVQEVADAFRRVSPQVDIVHIDSEDADTRDYRVSVKRLQAEGFSTRIDIETGGEEMVDAIVSGAIADPESLYYRNAKWLSELSRIGSPDHRAVAQMIEAMSRARHAST